MSTALPYRPALDGIRAVAVLLVLLHHARVPGFDGGFLGVDVFFVLSGFLITTLLLLEGSDEGGGRIDLAAFWARRVRRLLPAMLLVVLAVAAYAAWLAPETTRARLGADGAATLAYVANWWYLASGTDYFAGYADPSPLLHTWSLAVEEQFYLLWPLTVAAVLAVGRRWRRRLAPGATAPSAAAMGLLVTGIAVSAALTWWSTGGAAGSDGVDPSRAYYGTDTRAQELLAGALLAWAALRAGWWRDRAAGPSASSSPKAWTAAATVGAAVLAGAVVAVRDPAGWLHTGGYLLVSAASVALIGAAAHPDGGAVAWLLSRPVLVRLGVISYGVYLWHWPVFVVLTPDRTGLQGLALAATRIAVTLAVASASYRWVERPARGVDLRRLDPALRIALVPGACVAVLAVLVAAASAPAPPPTLQAGFSLESAPAATDPGPWLGPGTVRPPATAAGATTPARPTGREPLRVFVMGDSAAYNLHTESPPAASLGLQVGGSTQLGCDVLGGSLVVNGRPEPQAEVCRGWGSTWRSQVAATRPDVSVLTTGNGMLFDRRIGGRVVAFGSAEYEALLGRFLDETLRELRRSSAAVAVTDLPCFGKPDTGFDDTSVVMNDVRRQQRFNAILARLLARHRDVQLLPLRSLTCPGDVYRREVHGVRLHTDGVHWSRDGARLIWTWLAPRLRGL